MPEDQTKAVSLGLLPTYVSGYLKLLQSPYVSHGYTGYILLRIGYCSTYILVSINVTGFAKRGLVRTLFQFLLFTVIPQIQQYTNSSCLHHCQRFNGLLLLRLHSQVCLASTGARVVCKWLQLARPGIQLAGNHHRTGWLVRLGIDVATFCDMWSQKQPELKPFSHKKVFVSEGPTTSWLPTTPPPPL